MELQEILELMSKKYPADYKKGINPVLFVYDDGSGCILKDAQRSAYHNRNENRLYEFSNVDELIAHLQIV